jgi:hypothetical protein
MHCLADGCYAPYPRDESHCIPAYPFLIEAVCTDRLSQALIRLTLNYPFLYTIIAE